MLVENDYATYEKVGGILHVKYKNVVLDMAEAVQIVKDRLQFQKGHSIPVLCDIREVENISKSARAYLSLEGSAFVKAVGFIVDSPVSEMFSDFYISTNSPSIPTKSFSNSAEALKFLNSFK